MFSKKERKAGLEVISAQYGVTPNFQDVTAEVQALVKDGDLNFVVSPQTLGIIDPAPGILKTFQAKVQINGGQATVLQPVNDNEVFAISAEPLPDKESKNHFFAFAQTLWTAAMIMLAGYIGFSGYRLGSEGLGSSIFGYLLLFIAGGAFIGVASASMATGIPTLIFTSPVLFASIPLFIFFYSLIWPLGIDFNYSIKKLETI